MALLPYACLPWQKSGEHLYLSEHHLKYKQHGLIQDNCFLSDDDYVLALPLAANLDEEVQEDETDMFKKLIAEGVDLPVRLFFGGGGAVEEEDVLGASSDTDTDAAVAVAVAGLDVIDLDLVCANAQDTLLCALAVAVVWDVLPPDARACKANPEAKVWAEITSDMVEPNRAVVDGRTLMSPFHIKCLLK